MKSVRLFCVGILVCVAIYIGVFIGRNTLGNTIHLQDAQHMAENREIALLNLNNATADDLSTLPGIGPNTAREIIAYREKYGKFLYIEELLDVKGISKDIYNEIRPYITVE